MCLKQFIKTRLTRLGSGSETRVVTAGGAASEGDGDWTTWMDWCVYTGLAAQIWLSPYFSLYIYIYISLTLWEAAVRSAAVITWGVSVKLFINLTVNNNTTNNKDVGMNRVKAY